MKIRFLNISISGFISRGWTYSDSKLSNEEFANLRVN
jgi:hypothetical protein